MSGLKRLIHEIHRRSLWQVLAIYLLGAGVGYQLIEALVSGLGLPAWFPALAIVLFIVGLPIVLATAFAQEGLSPAARQQDPTLLPEGGRPEDRGVQRLFTWRNAIFGGVLAFALWGVVATGWLVLGPGVDGRSASASAEVHRSIAVLPFVNMEGDENASFTNGIHEDILTHLSKISDLTVISRTSVMLYAGSDKPSRRIAEELGVGALLEGSVRRAGGQVRVVTQLIDAETDAHLWAETYDRELTAENVFAIQSDVAQQIARALQAELSLEEQERISGQPTASLEAYDLYVRGNEYLRGTRLERDLRSAMQSFEMAIELDPKFALAFAKLSEAHLAMYWFHYDRSEERLVRAREAVDSAFKLEPGLPEAHQSLGLYYYWGYLDYERALEQFAIVQRSRPNDADLLVNIGAVQRRQGKMELAAANMKKASELDPRSFEVAFNLGATYNLLRNLQEAERHLGRVISLSPDYALGYQLMAWHYLRGQGNTERARSILEKASQNTVPGDYASLVISWVLTDLLDRSYQDALSRLAHGVPEAIETQFYFVTKAQLYAQIYGLLNRPELQRAYYDSARALLEAKLQEEPDDARLHSALGIAHAGLGRVDEAMREGELGVELLPVSTEAWRGLYRVEDLARIYVMVGEYDAAIDQLEFLLSIPGEISASFLRLDPTWDPLRDHPRFQRLLEGHR